MTPEQEETLRADAEVLEKLVASQSSRISKLHERIQVLSKRKDNDLWCDQFEFVLKAILENRVKGMTNEELVEKVLKEYREDRDE